jgi:molecular chaperone HtpG
MTENTEAKTHKFKAEVTQVLDLVVNSLYSNKEIFLRELISNAADALDRLRFESISNEKLQPENHQPKIRIIPDRDKSTLTIWDNGIGMGKSDLAKELGTIAHSGSKELVQKLQEAKDANGDLQLIGQFGVGFYSSYLVAERVEVVSRAAGSSKSFRWSSDGKQTFTVEPAEREEIGTSVVLYLKEDQKDFLSEWRLRELTKRYSDFINHTIELLVERTDQDDKEKKEKVFETVNQASALWKRPPKEISDDQYDEFYKHLTHDYEKPFARSHFSVEGKQMFTALLFVPKRPPFDLFMPETKHGVRLYVRRVFIMDDCEELLPQWLRFVRGVIDSDDLPLNISRELLQDSQIVRTIRKQIVRRVLDVLSKKASDSPDDYLEFWRAFGPVIKEGLHYDPEQNEKISKLLRYESTADQGLTPLSDYVKRMPEGQKSIYYAIGTSRDVVANSPHLEGLKKKGYEVLLMTDTVDQWAVESLQKFEDKPLVNAMREDFKLEEAPQKEEEKSEDQKKADREDKEESEQEKALKPLIERCKEVLADHVSEVRVSERLTDSPACLVIPKGGLPAHIERLLRATQRGIPESKRILELNPNHPLVKRLLEVQEKNAKPEQLSEWIELIYDQALLTEGSPIPDPQRFASRVTQLLQTAVDLNAAKTPSA